METYCNDMIPAKLLQK